MWLSNSGTTANRTSRSPRSWWVCRWILRTWVRIWGKNDGLKSIRKWRKNGRNPRFSLKNAGKSSPGRVYASISLGSTNKKGTFVYQKFLFCLSKPQAWHIITTQSCISSRAASRPCISSRASVHLPAAWWYTMLRSDDIPQQVADDIHAFGVIGMRETENLLIILLKYVIIHL